MIVVMIVTCRIKICILTDRTDGLFCIHDWDFRDQWVPLDEWMLARMNMGRCTYYKEDAHRVWRGLWSKLDKRPSAKRQRTKVVMNSTKDREMQHVEEMWLCVGSLGACGNLKFRYCSQDLL